MKKLLQLAAALLLLSIISFHLTTAHAQGTAFTYQGRLNDGTNAATGSYDLRFALFDTLPGGTGTQQGNLLTNSATAVSNGLFTVTLDFGNQFPGAPRWLEIGVRSNGVATFITLAPRQPLTPTPYAVYAESANATNLVGTVSGSQIAAGSIGATQLSNSVSLWNRSGADISYTAGKVGVGTSTPAKALDVTGTSSGVASGVSVDSSIFVRVSNTASDGNTSSPDFAGIGFGRTAVQQAIVGGTFGNDVLDFYTGGSLTSPKMRIDFSGNVGIGTSSPIWPLHVVGAGGGSSGIIAAETTGGNGGPQLRLKVGGPNSQEWVFVANGTINGPVGDLQIIQQSGGSRMVIRTNGNVGIGTTTPNNDSRLQVNGMVRMGSETGTTEAPNRSILVRRVNSTSSATGQVVARGLTVSGNIMTLERDGSNGGLIIKLTGSGSNLGGAQISGYGITASGTFVGVNKIGLANNSSTQIFTDAQRICNCRLSFGEPLNDSDMTTVELMRLVDTGIQNDNFWAGTVTSTVNQ